MIIVVEGADATGKTTLARRVIDRWENEHGAPGDYLHAMYDPDQWTHDTALLRRAVETHLEGRLAVMDRAWLGNDTYGRVFRNSDCAPWVRRHDSVLRRYGALYVLAAPPAGVVDRLFTETKNERPEMFDRVHEVADMYRRLYTGGANHDDRRRFVDGTANYVEQEILHGGWMIRDDVIGYDRTLWTRSPVDLILTTARGVELRAEPFDALGFNLSGRPGPGVTLLVGERAGSDREPRSWPFFNRIGSAAYLTVKIHEAKLREVNLAYVNALRVDGTPEPNLGTVATACGRVVALGEVAHRYLCEANVLHRKVAHPQYHRRFLHHGDYAEQLREACAP